MAEFRLDDSFITYRYARNLAEGNGLVYNLGDNVLSTTAPLYAMLLALGSIAVSDFHTLGGLIGTFSIGLGGWLIYRLLPEEMPRWIRLWVGVAYTLGSPIWLSLGMETAFWVMLVLAACICTFSRRFAAAGLLISLATLARPDAALPGALVFFYLLVNSFNHRFTTQHAWKPVVAYVIAGAIPVVVFVAWATLTYGSPIPVTLGAKSAQAVLGITGLGLDVTYWEGLRLILRSLFSQSPLYIVLALLLLFGLASRLAPAITVVVAWSAAHLLAYIVLGVAPYRWYYVPLMPGALLLAACGLHDIQQRLAQRRFRLTVPLVSGLALFALIAPLMSFRAIADQMLSGGRSDPMLPVVDWQAYRETGEWIDQNSPVDARIGVAEVGQLGFFARRWMSDYLGLLQPDVSAMLRRGDLYSWLVDYAPDYLVFQRFRGAGLVLYNFYIQEDAWFNANYQRVAEFDDPRYPAGPVTVFQRMTSITSPSTVPIGADFGGLRLTGYALDQSMRSSIRIRLDWQVVGSLPEKLHIAVKGLGIAGSNPGFDGDYDTTHWAGTFSTWHGFVLPSASQAGDYPLLVAISETGSTVFLEQRIGSMSLVEGQ